MGRGRAKAKQTRVARDLKYRSVETDFASLERELRQQQSSGEYEEVPEQYSDLADQYAEYDDYDEEERR
ncbi:DUF3073 domain-containing protein [Tessaracoccus sp. OH4464_COT-324]|uniref:DUF3073 domain-containing protein n=1 Tax=Tessaracoccus sp. OH4464_COT-324 TaxID=2491059 RepID=UPI000F63DFAF|nr:DUF3073 domain-containing protein [Tessaracoccus sp. OH4464_COT-324]RRD46944.1 DUF3073 domain-containing protein [Tessaracoccus sp. OH4464_COT-324]